MMKFELKKVLCKTSSRIALFLLAAILIFNCWLTIGNIRWVNERGESEYGLSSIQKVRDAQKAWAGYLNEEHLRAVLTELKRIEATPEAQSSDYHQNDIAFGWKQGMSDIRDLLNLSFAPGFRNYDYYVAETVSEDRLSQFDENRIRLLKEWLRGNDRYSDAEKAFLIKQYEALETPMYYDYCLGWVKTCEGAMLPIAMCVLILGYIVAGFFADEFRWYTDSILFSTVHGRKKAVSTKVRAMLLLVTVVYWSVMLIHSVVLLGIIGFDGANCPIQTDLIGWRCFYNVTNWQQYAIVLAEGYLGILFFSLLTMWISAKTRSAVFAVTVPFILVFLPAILDNLGLSWVDRILCLLPDQLIMLGGRFQDFNLVSIGNREFGSIPFDAVLYSLLTALLIPVCYQEFRRKQVL